MTKLKQTLKINLVAPPSRGKTSLSYLLAAKLKFDYQADVELVTEFAKEKTFMGIDLFTQNHEAKLLEIAEQTRRENIFMNKVDLLISSSPLAIVGFYLKEEQYLNEVKKQIANQNCQELYFYLTQDKSFKFETNGRDLWSEDRMSALEKSMLDYCANQKINLIHLTGSPEARVEAIINKIKVTIAQREAQDEDLQNYSSAKAR